MSILDRSQGRWGWGRVGGRRGAPRRRPRGAIGLEALEVRVVMSTAIWSGLDAASSTKWSDTGNWENNAPPAPGDDIVFPSGVPGLTNTNDLGANIAYDTLTIAGSGYSIGGENASFTSIDASQTSGSSEVDIPVALAGPGTVSVDQSGAELVLGGVISGTIGLTKNGPGTLDLTAGNSYTGTTAINAGELVVDGSQGGSPVTASSGTTLSGIGTVGSITTAGATVSPGDGGTAGILTDTGSLSLGPDSSSDASTYSVVLDGSTAGTGAGFYSQTEVAGSIVLNNANLNVTLGPDFNAPIGTTFTIVDNTGSSAVSGTFNGQAQGSTIEVDGTTFEISYLGGTNKDSIVLTELNPSTTQLSANPTTAVYGQPVDLTATVTGPNGTPTGTVDFYNGTTLLGTETLTAGVASLQVSTLPISDNPITATYLGDSNYAGSQTAAVPVTVNMASATVSLSTFPISPVSGSPITFTANVAAAGEGAGTPTGTVQFYSGTSALGSPVTLADGVATYQTSSLSEGSYSITAVYGGDSNFQAGATSPAVPLTVASSASTTTTLSASTTSPVYGQNVDFTATVEPSGSSSNSPTGTVQFLNGTTVLATETLAGGVANYSTSSLALGSNLISAVYSGDDNFTSSTSDTQTVTVELSDSSTAVTYAPASPVANQSITLTATVTATGPGSGTPTGTVQFFNGSTSLGTADLTNGVATYTVSGGFAAVANTISAQYEGDNDFNGSTSPNVTITPTATATSTTTVTYSPSAPVYGDTVTLTATVTPVSPLTETPTGTVVFYNGTTSLGTASLTDGVAQLTGLTLPNGANPITAQYSGDSTFTSSVSSATTVTVALSPTSTAVTFAPGNPAFGQSVALTATISATTTGAELPTGTVTFYNGSNSLGTATATDGVATLNLNTLLVGPNTITAQYAGDTNYAASTSPAVSVPVSQSLSTTTITYFPSSPVAGQNVTLTATVAASGLGAGTPTGTVQFFNGTTSLGTATIANGVATLTTALIPAGDNAITGQYSGDANFVASTSPAVTVNVASSATSDTTVTFSPPTPTYGQTVTITATVAPVNSSTDVPTGTVEFFNSVNGTTTLLGTESLTPGTSSSTAVYSTSALPVASNSITAQYSGDSNFTSSTSSPVTVMVSTVSTTTALAYTPTSPTYGTNVEFTATVTPATTGAEQPSGNVDFYNGSTLLGSAALANDVADFSTTALPVGANSITATYVGDTNYATSTSTPATVVTVTQQTTTTAVTFSPTLPVYGQAVTLTATITPASTGPASPTGTVQFFNGSTLLGSGTVSNDVATLDIPLPVGTNSVTAKYLGDSNYSGSTSSADAFAVVLAATTTSLSTSTATPAAFQSVTLTAAVSVTSPGGGSATGTVEFFANGAELGTATLANGVATLSVVPPVAINSITAEYLGSGNLQPSTSSAVTVTAGTANQLWLNQVYLVELGRAPTQSEVTKDIRQLARGVSRLSLVTKIANSAEATNYMVSSDYQQYIGAQPTAKQVHQILAEADRTHTSVLAVILGSDQFYDTTGGGLFNYLGALQQAVLGTQTQQPSLQAKLERGVSRTKVANDLIQSKVGNLGIVPGNFVAALGRAPTRAELGSIVSLMSRGQYLRNIIASLLAGNEFYKQSTT